MGQTANVNANKAKAKCGKPCVVMSRVTGFYRPVQNWNNGKQQEKKDRKEYII